MHKIKIKDSFLEETLVSAYELDDYIKIMEKISAKKYDKEFRKEFNGYYRIRQKSKQWYNCYYSLLEEQSEKNRSFREILEILYDKGGENKVEASFASKLLASVDPEKAIWDSKVLKNIGFYNEWNNYELYHGTERIELADRIYNNINSIYNDYLLSKYGKEIIRKFDEMLPSYKEKITNIKKIDCIIWKNGC